MGLSEENSYKKGPPLNVCALIHQTVTYKWLFRPSQRGLNCPCPLRTTQAGARRNTQPTSLPLTLSPRPEKEVVSFSTSANIHDALSSRRLQTGDRCDRPVSIIAYRAASHELVSFTLNVALKTITVFAECGPIPRRSSVLSRRARKPMSVPGVSQAKRTRRSSSSSKSQRYRTSN